MSKNTVAHETEPSIDLTSCSSGELIARLNGRQVLELCDAVKAGLDAVRQLIPGYDPLKGHYPEDSKYGKSTFNEYEFRPEKKLTPVLLTGYFICCPESRVWAFPGNEPESVIVCLQVLAEDMEEDPDPSSDGYVPCGTRTIAVGMTRKSCLKQDKYGVVKPGAHGDLQLFAAAEDVRVVERPTHWITFAFTHEGDAGYVLASCYPGKPDKKADMDGLKEGDTVSFDEALERNISRCSVG